MTFEIHRRSLLKASGALAVGFAAPSILRAQTPTIKVGVIEPLTGNLAYNGTQSAAGAKFAAEAINAAGGIKSMGGAKIELVVVDAQSRPEAAAAAVDTLIQADACAFTGATASALGLASSQAAAKYNLAQVFSIGTAETVVQRGLPNVFRFTPGVNKCTSVALENLKLLNESTGSTVKTAAIVHEDGPFGSNMAKILAEQLPKQGIEVVETISHPTPQRDFSNIALRVKASKADILIPSNYINEYTLMARALSQQRVELKAIYSILGGAASNIKFVRENNKVAQYVMDCNHWYDPSKDLSKALAASVAAANLDMTYDVMVSYATIQVIADALERSGSADRQKMIEALAASTFDQSIMPYGPIKFVNGDNVNSRPVNTQIRGEKIELVFPKEYATAEAVFPIPAQN
ncbi:branched-chain amino acid transport system substrate-binding protein [Rhizobium skierniewicense]|uniref:Branched-chain amino acid transport system substrate-binding protein n=1 Tax=Rhizobium skierniewicense TaxID=984260 RepID=A0A7W6G074_9HYPH|nr:ABC transporter substrate-binding protein [Rhizobium skierniewicense]MBB3944375.1 branched-chain amino acid transport system substrate-binding protein [Rhizobium skierniewicense]